MTSHALSPSVAIVGIEYPLICKSTDTPPLDENRCTETTSDVVSLSTAARTSPDTRLTALGVDRDCVATPAALVVHSSSGAPAAWLCICRRLALERRTTRSPVPPGTS